MNDSLESAQQHTADLDRTAGLNELNATADFGILAAAAEHGLQGQWASTPNTSQPARTSPPSNTTSSSAPGKARRRSTTEEEYRYRASLLWRQATEAKTTDPQQPPMIKPIDVVDFLIERSKSLQQTTWGLYRSALLFEFGSRLSDGPSYQEAYDKLAMTRESSGPRRRRTAGDQPDVAPMRATRSSKAGLPKNDLAMLLDQLGLQNRTAGWGARAQYWLLATLATGVRPNEWEHASWGDQAQTWLLAPNSKRKVDVPAFHRQNKAAPADQQQTTQLEEDGIDAGDVDGPAKTFRAIPVGSDSRVFVDLHLSSLNGCGLEFQVYYNNCRTAIWSACKKIWKGKKTYSLYSARHQYSANTKAAYQIGDVAELMGQTDEKSPMHYAPRRLAYPGAGGLSPAPAEGQNETEAGQGDRRQTQPGQAEAGQGHDGQLGAQAA
jgi:hypothetical protein